MSDNKQKTIGVVHVVYLSIIFSGVVIWLIAYIFGTSTYAGSLLTFAGTLSSILLAVIAIIITLIDVAGQRSNILDVKNSVEELKKVSTEITTIVGEFEKSNILRQENMMETITQFNKDIEINTKKFDEITANLGKISLTGESQKELEKIKVDITEMKDSLKKPFEDKNYNFTGKIMDTKNLLHHDYYTPNLILRDKTGKILYQDKGYSKE